jgi:hypothetical protein
MVLQLAEVAVTRALFADIQRRIDVAATTVAAAPCMRIGSDER